MLVSKFLDPKNDFAFKSVFGTERHQDILIHFINDILELTGESRIKSVTFLKLSQDPEIASKKQSLVDVLCTDEKGYQYIIEMQVARTAGFEKRAQYYAARAYGRQLMEGEGYHRLKAVIFIAITNFEMFPEKSDYKSMHCILDKRTYEQDLKDFSFTFLELPKFTKGIDELTDITDKWLYFFKHAEETQESELPQIIGNDKVISKAYEALNRYSWDEVEMNTYEQEEKRERDADAILLSAREEGVETGFKKGREEGIEVGLEKGREKEREEIASNLLSSGMTKEQIAGITGLPLEAIKCLSSSGKLKS